MYPPPPTGVPPDISKDKSNMIIILKTQKEGMCRVGHPMPIPK
jgi:hypothetical protein